MHDHHLMSGRIEPDHNRGTFPTRMTDFIVVVENNLVARCEYNWLRRRLLLAQGFLQNVITLSSEKCLPGRMNEPNPLFVPVVGRTIVGTELVRQNRGNSRVRTSYELDGGEALDVVETVVRHPGSIKKHLKRCPRMI